MKSSEKYQYNPMLRAARRFWHETFGPHTGLPSAARGVTTDRPTGDRYITVVDTDLAGSDESAAAFIEDIDCGRFRVVDIHRGPFPQSYQEKEPYVPVVGVWRLFSAAQIPAWARQPVPQDAKRTENGWTWQNPEPDWSWAFRLSACDPLKPPLQQAFIQRSESLFRPWFTAEMMAEHDAWAEALGLHHCYIAPWWFAEAELSQKPALTAEEREALKSIRSEVAEVWRMIEQHQKEQEMPKIEVTAETPVRVVTGPSHENVGCDPRVSVDDAIVVGSTGLAEWLVNESGLDCQPDGSWRFADVWDACPKKVWLEMLRGVCEVGDDSRESMEFDHTICVANEEHRILSRRAELRWRKEQDALDGSRDAMCREAYRRWLSPFGDTKGFARAIDSLEKAAERRSDVCKPDGEDPQVSP